MWVALTWRIWHHRNRLIFSNEEFHGPAILKLGFCVEVIYFCWLWLKNMERILKYLITYGPAILKLGFCVEGDKVFCGWDLSCSSSQCFGTLIYTAFRIYLNPKTEQ